MPGFPLPQGWLVLTSAAQLGPVAVLHPRENAGIELRDSHPLALGAPTAAGEQSFFYTKVELAAMIHGTAERYSSQ